MIEMVIVYCLVSDTKACIEKRLRMESFTSLISCTMSGQQRAQEYLRDHPAYQLKNWRCEMNVPRQTRNETADAPVVASVSLPSGGADEGGHEGGHEGDPTMPVLQANAAVELGSRGYD